MRDPTSAHERFIEFVQAFYRQADAELPYFDCTPEAAIAFEVLVGDVTFIVGYDPAAIGNAKLLVHCTLGPLPQHAEGPVLQRLLELNLSRARNGDAIYCVDPETQEVGCFLRSELAPVDIPALHAEMVLIAQDADRWRHGHF